MAKKDTKTPKTNKLVKKYREIVNDQSILFSSIVAAVIVVISVIYIFLTASSLPTQIPLYYSLASGEQRLAPATALLIIPAASLVINVVNLSIIFFLYKNEPVMSRILAIGAAFTTIVGAYTLLRIILLIS